jgi:hypothetical protein
MDRDKDKALPLDQDLAKLVLARTVAMAMGTAASIVPAVVATPMSALTAAATAALEVEEGTTTGIGLRSCPLLYLRHLEP